MFNQNIISNKFDLNLSTTLSSQYHKVSQLFGIHYNNLILMVISYQHTVLILPFIRQHFESFQNVLVYIIQHWFGIGWYHKVSQLFGIHYDSLILNGDFLPAYTLSVPVRTLCYIRFHSEAQLSQTTLLPCTLCTNAF